MKDIVDETIHWQGTSFRTRLSTQETGGAMCIVESVTPVNWGPPRHVHDAEDECFVVLSGELLVWVAGETRRLGPGQSAFIPRGTEHTFQTIGEKPCRHLVILTPGGFEGFFADMALGQFDIPGDMGAIEESAGRHNLRFTGPPLEVA